MWFLQSGLSLYDVLARILAVIIIVFFVLPIHEYAHALVAYKLGDKSIKYSGRMTLNPLAHLDLLGALSILLFSFGWANPVPVDSSYFKNPKRDLALTALAGPVSNLIAAILGGFALNLIIFTNASFMGNSVNWIYSFLSYFIIINISLAAFNLVPVPPLDGSKILEAFIPNKYLSIYYENYQKITLIMLILLLFGVFNTPITFIQGVLYKMVLTITSFPFYFV